MGEVFAPGPVSSSSESQFTSFAFWSEQLSAQHFSLTFNPRRFCLWEIRFTLLRGIFGVFGSFSLVSPSNLDSPHSPCLFLQNQNLGTYV